MLPRIFPLFLWLTLNSACSRWQNQVNWLRFDCGEGMQDAPGLVVQFKGPQGQKLLGSELEVLLADRALRVSEHACVLLPKDSEAKDTVLAVSRTKAWGVQWPLAETKAGQRDLKVLQEPLPLSFDCQLDQDINQAALLAVAFQETTRQFPLNLLDAELRSAHYQLLRTDRSGEEERSQKGRSVREVLAAIRQDLQERPPREGSYRARLEVETIRRQTYVFESGCSRRLDLSPPSVSAIVLEKAWLKAQEPLRLSSFNEGELLSCWTPAKEDGPSCASLESFRKTGTLLEPPGPGAWTLHLRAQDKLGNISADRTETIRVDVTAPEIQVSWQGSEKAAWTILRELESDRTIHIELSDQAEAYAPSVRQTLRDHLQCRAEFVKSDEGRIAGDMVACESGACAGKTLENWQNCSTDFRIHLQAERVPLDTQLRVYVRTQDQVGLSAEATLMALVPKQILNPWYKDENFPLQTALSRGSVRFIRDEQMRVSYALMRADRHSPYQLALNIAEDEEWYGPAPLEGAADFLEDANPGALLLQAAMLKQSESERVWIARRGRFPELLRIDRPLSRTGLPRPTEILKLPEALQEKLGEDSMLMDMIYDPSQRTLVFGLWDQKQISLLQYDGRDWTLLWQSQNAIEPGFLMQLSLLTRGSSLLIGLRREVWILEHDAQGFEARTLLNLTKPLSTMSLLPGSGELAITQMGSAETEIWRWDAEQKLIDEPSLLVSPLATGTQVLDLKHVQDQKGQLYLTVDTKGEGAPLIFQLARTQLGWQWRPFLTWLPYDFRPADESFPWTDLMDDGRGGLLLSGRLGVFRRKASCWIEADKLLQIDQKRSRYLTRPFGPAMLQDKGPQGKLWQLAELQNREWVVRRMGALGWETSSLPAWPESLANPVAIAAAGPEALWTTHNRGGLMLVERQPEGNWDTRLIFPGGSIRFGLQQRDGVQWVEHAQKIYRLDPQTRFPQLSQAKDLPQLSLQTKYWGIGADGELLLIDPWNGGSKAFMSGLKVQDKVQSLVEYPKGRLTAVIERISRDQVRQLLLASFEDDSDAWQLWDEKYQPQHAIQGRLLVDGQGQLWGETLTSGSQSAVAIRWDGARWRVFLPQDIARNVPLSLTIDGQGEVWGEAQGVGLFYDRNCDGESKRLP